MKMNGCCNEKKAVCELADTSKVEKLFEGWRETLIYSCLQKVMGKIYVTDPAAPESAMAYVGCFAFYAGVPDKTLVSNKPGDFVIMTPQNEAWAACIEECFPEAEKMTRYAIKKDTKFDVSRLQKMVERLPEGAGQAAFETTFMIWLPAFSARSIASASKRRAPVAI